MVTTCKDNMDTKVGLSEYGARCGEDHPKAVLDWETVELIRDLSEEHGISAYAIAEELGLKRQTVRDVVEYRTWAFPPVIYVDPQSVRRLKGNGKKRNRNTTVRK